MKIPVYEITDGEAYNGFVKITKAAIIPAHTGIKTEGVIVNLRRVTQRYPDNKKPLPVNYKKITKAQAVDALKAAQYGYLMVSATGRDTMKHFNIPSSTRWEG